MGPDPAAITTQACLCGDILALYDHYTKVICQKLVKREGSCSEETQYLLSPGSHYKAHSTICVPIPMSPAPAPAAWVFHADSSTRSI